MDVASAPAGSVVAPTKLRVPDGDGAPPARILATPAVRLALVDGPTARALAAADRRPVAWLGLDPEDADPVRLWRGIIAALRTLQPGFGTDAEQILAAGPAALTGAVVPLVAAEAARFLEPPLLVLDRYNLLGDRARETVPSLSAWLVHAPVGALLVVADAPADADAALHAAAGHDQVRNLKGTVPAANLKGTVPAARTPGTPAARFDAALAAGEPATAAAILAAVWPTTLARGEHGTVRTMLAALPPDAAAAEPGLFLPRVWGALQDGDLGRAQRQLDDDADTPSTLTARGRLLHAHDALRRGDLEALAQRIDAAAEADAADGYWHTTEALLRAHEAFWRGHPRVAHRHFARAAGLAHIHDDRYALTAALGYLALLATEGGDDDAARRRLGRIEDLADADPATSEHPVAIGGALAEGRLLELAGALESSVAPLTRAIALAARGGSRFEQAEPHLRLAAVHRACHRPDEAEHAEAQALRILAACPDPGGRLAGPAAAIAPHARGAAPHRLLSPSERQILRLLPTGLSQREIGDQLFLSVNTVKTHCRNIYTKLAAQSREQAVARARGLGLL